MNLKIKQFMAGIVVGCTIMMTANAYGETIMKSINVEWNSINIKINGSYIQTDNILYNNTTYVPLRKIADELNAKVDWNEATNTATFNTVAEYFPAGIFNKEDARSDSLVSQGYSENLSALEEPSIYQLSTDKNVLSYRFLYLRTFHNPISVRIDINSEDKTAFLLYKRCDGRGGYEPGTIDEAKKIQLSEKDVEKLKEMINTEGFWNLSSTEESGGRDGAEWIIEVASEGKYHLVDRWSPEDGPIRKLGLLFLELAKVEAEIY